MALLKILFLLASVAYLAFEFSFNAMLLDASGVMFPTANEVHTVEVYGRLVSSCGLVLLVLSFFGGNRWQLDTPATRVAGILIAVVFASPFLLTSDATFQLRVIALSGATILLLVAIVNFPWRAPLFVIGLVLSVGPGMYVGQKALLYKLFVDDSTGAERKAALGLTMLKGGIAAGMINLEQSSFDSRNIQTPEGKTALVLLGGLSGMSDSFIERTLAQADAVIERAVVAQARQELERAYRDYRRKVDEFHSNNWEPYKAASLKYQSEIAEAANSVEQNWALVGSQIDKGWADYNDAVRVYETGANDDANRAYPGVDAAVHRLSDCQRRKRNRAECLQRVEERYNTNKGLHNALGGYVPLSDWCRKVEKTGFEKALDAGIGLLSGNTGALMVWQDTYDCSVTHEIVRNRILINHEDSFRQKSGGYPIGLDYAGFKRHSLTSASVRERLAQQGLILPDDWQPTDAASFRTAYLDGVRKRAEEKWAGEIQRRAGFFVQPSLHYEKFLSTNEVENRIKQSVGAAWFPGFSLDMTEQQFWERVVQPKATSEVSKLLAMFEEADTAFADGGAFEERGKQAIASLRIPPISLSLSLFFALVTLVKSVSAFAGLADNRNKNNKPSTGGINANVLRASTAIVLTSVIAVAPFFSTNSFAESRVFRFLADEFSASSMASHYPVEWVIRMQPLMYPVGAGINENLNAPFIWLKSADILKDSPLGAFETTITPVNVGRNMLGQIQAELKKEGMYDGAIDGLNGPRTQDAIKQFQLENDFPVTGQVTLEMIRALGLD